ncbi:SDR family oxidoreductase [Rhodococcus sp. BP-349]|uniref:SDR family oxidoreductase n=1 Tax=unclassified Rhodococcus (in: high G+C Gram-positive bacteria) TaxID=192944 RepID=UPI001C9B2BEB|nr:MULTISPECIES: SDR family oxidoreductase [unclassified Rhodococcus (in: high G+C Gram-positive bacteria)]MBY6538468.1 SDR family oxidoreductase [Rhodococcus sp. BP-363]MBY6542805.1 SDR family oxidoreductase [Rhodococcus sp. BP-369]MBY6562035.1 SDR family oxidoreductase [Rhodococcus sp. BP-370]MBY6576327.1 SDR family oxidoreductase [Rhodococcus sp. BP-364]MBY6585628.1 SDR family oxidoreductase [Rhodococcus sp. BP-358]
MAARSPGTALVVGATGISGQTICRRLVDAGWRTYGLSRKTELPVDGVTPVTADLLDADALREALRGTAPDLVFFTAWMMQDSEAENIEVNTATLRNTFDALAPENSVKHVALMTGLKHYLGPFDAYGAAVTAETPFHESEERLDTPNFYYAQEDELFSGAERLGFTWSVHRAHTIFGFAVGNAMNMALTLSVYATLCKETGQPFVFPGSETQWNGLTDVTDADLLAEQMIWAATNENGANEPFNVANGDVFRWRWLWPRIADHFGIEPVGFDTEPRPLATRMDDAPDAWRRIAEKYDLVESDVTRLASWWHTDGDLGRDMECLTDMTKSRKAGFLGFRSTSESFAENLARYRDARIIPR